MKRKAADPLESNQVKDELILRIIRKLNLIDIASIACTQTSWTSIWPFVEELSIVPDKKDLFCNIIKCSNLLTLNIVTVDQHNSFNSKKDFWFFTALTGLKHLVFTSENSDVASVDNIDECTTFDALINVQSLRLHRVSCTKRKGLKFLYHFENLEKLELVKPLMNYDGISLRILGELDTLRCLKLQDLAIGDEELKILVCLPKLEEFSISDDGDESSYLDGSFGRYFSSQHLTRCDIGNIKIRHLSHLTSLQYVQFTYLDEEDITALASYTNLRTLQCTLGRTGCYQQFEEVLAKLTNLENLVFPDIYVPENISMLINLTYLCIWPSSYQCSIISTLVNLKTLRINGSDGIPPIADYATCLKSLSTIEVEGEDVDVEDLKKGLPNVTISLLGDNRYSFYRRSLDY